jgi:transcriptional regulator with XRE-family HTH domain
MEAALSAPVVSGYLRRTPMRDRAAVALVQRWQGKLSPLRRPLLVAYTITNRIPTTFAGALRAFREARGYTQGELADFCQHADDNRLAGIVASAVAHWEQGARVPVPPQLLVLTRTLECTQVEALWLVELAALQSKAHATIVQVLAGLRVKDRHQAWVTWAASQTTRPTRGRVERQEEEAGAPVEHPGRSERPTLPPRVR